MLSLQERPGATHVCDLVTGKSRGKPVYYYHDVDDKLLTKVDSVADLLKSHTADIKDRLKVNSNQLNDAIELIQHDKEPDESHSGAVRRSYYHVKRLVKQLLREEMDLLDQKGKSRFEINYPTKDVSDWGFGTAFVAGSSGSGKGYFTTSLILRHWKAANPRNRRHVWYITPELHDDLTLRRISDLKKYEPWFHGIDVSFETFETSGKSEEQFFQDAIKGPLSHQRNCIICVDDSQDSPIAADLRKFTDRLLRTGRHKGNSVITLQHSLRNSAFSRPSVLELWSSLRYIESPPSSLTLQGNW